MIVITVMAAAAILASSGYAAAEARERRPTSEHPQDSYAYRPFAADFEARRKAYLAYCLGRSGGGRYAQMARLAAGGDVNERSILAVLKGIDARHDCADFRVNGLLRLLYQFGDCGKLSDGLLKRVRTSLLNFKYWPDEPGIDSMCSWSENHQIMFSTAGYLAGQLFPDTVFTNSGQTGREKMRVHRRRVMRWLDLRFRTGFSEWLSNHYYDMDITPLLNLIDFSGDQEIVKRATMVLDLMLTDMALNSFHGTFGSTHGRSYEDSKKWAHREATSSIQKLLFGMGAFSPGQMSTTCLAISKRYHMPQVIHEIAADLQRPEVINRQRMGIRIAEAERWGLGFDNHEDGMVLLSLEAYAHPRTFNLFVDMLDAFDWWDNSFHAPFKARRRLINALRRLGLLPVLAVIFEKDICRNTREEVNVYTYRTPDYMLSSAQDYRKGYGGDQQHIWQATLGPNAVCFTTHPPSRRGRGPGYWVGSGNLPRVAQVKNVAIVIYNISRLPGLYVTNRLFFTHAWLPKDQFDEVVEKDGWIFARRGSGYLALRSQRAYHWQTNPGGDKDREIIAPGQRNVWICELGRCAVDGDFAQFVKRICEVPVSFGRLSVRYASPSRGQIEFDWNGPLRQNGNIVPLHDYPRYENPYARTDFPLDKITLRCGAHALYLNWPNLERRTKPPTNDSVRAIMRR